MPNKAKARKQAKAAKKATAAKNRAARKQLDAPALAGECEDAQVTGKKLYKYFGPELAPVALTDSGAILKYSLPDSFNDPYELFLTVDFSVGPDALASYQDQIEAIPQHPTTCFSNSPAVTPMWAHYGQNVTGFVIEVDEDLLKQEFPDSTIQDVRYQDEPDAGLTEMLHRAHYIGKFRYTYMLTNGCMYAAYFTKAKCWSYESERRMIVGADDVRKAAELLLLDVPARCITAIIIGARASDAVKAKLTERAGVLGCPVYQMQIGRSSISPYFLNTNGKPYIFDGRGLVPAPRACEQCSEPCSDNAGWCSWCQITDAHRYVAAQSNAYRMLDRVGALESYIESMDEITAGITRHE